MSKGKPRPKPGRKAPAESKSEKPPRPDHTKIALSFEHYECGGRYCLSQWNQEQILSFLACLQKLSQRTWVQLLEASSKNPTLKTGLNPTLYKESELSGVSWPAWLIRDSKILGLRATDRRRVFGVRLENVFYVLWFDEGHQVCKM